MKRPKNSDKYFWTTHSVYKMRQYGLSEQKIRNVIKSPQRKEEGIVKNTVAVMQPINPKVDGKKKIWKQEIWVMYQKAQSAKRKTQNENSNPTNIRPFERGGIKGGVEKIKIISAWRYPGVSPERNPIPAEILQEIEEMV